MTNLVCAVCCVRRAKYIVGSVQALLDKPEGGRAWLLGLRDKPYAEAHEALCSLPGTCSTVLHVASTPHSTAQHIAAQVTKMQQYSTSSKTCNCGGCMCRACNDAPIMTEVGCYGAGNPKVPHYGSCVGTTPCLLHFVLSIQGEEQLQSMHLMWLLVYLTLTPCMYCNCNPAVNTQV